MQAHVYLALGTEPTDLGTQDTDLETESAGTRSPKAPCVGEAVRDGTERLRTSLFSTRPPDNCILTVDGNHIVFHPRHCVRTMQIHLVSRRL